MGQPQGEEEEEGWDVEGRVMTRGTEGVERWGEGEGSCFYVINLPAGSDKAQY